MYETDPSFKVSICHKFILPSWAILWDRMCCSKTGHSGLLIVNKFAQACNWESATAESVSLSPGVLPRAAVRGGEGLRGVHRGEERGAQLPPPLLPSPAAGPASHLPGNPHWPTSPRGHLHKSYPSQTLDVPFFTANTTTSFSQSVSRQKTNSFTQFYICKQNLPQIWEQLVIMVNPSSH